MTHNELESILDRINNELEKQTCITNPLTDTVTFCYFWRIPLELSHREIDYLPLPCYLIRENRNSPYQSIVLDMTNDLHVFTKPECRCKGILKRAFTELIFHHLSLDKESQRITLKKVVDTVNVPLLVAEKLGFKIVPDLQSKDLVLEIDLEPYAMLDIEYLPSPPGYPSIETMEQILWRATDARNRVMVCRYSFEAIGYYDDVYSLLDSAQNCLQSAMVDLQEVLIDIKTKKV